MYSIWLFRQFTSFSTNQLRLDFILCSRLPIRHIWLSYTYRAYLGHQTFLVILIYFCSVRCVALGIICFLSTGCTWFSAMQVLHIHFSPPEACHCTTWPAPSGPRLLPGLFSQVYKYFQWRGHLGIDPAWWALWNQWFRTSCLGPISCQSQSLQVNPCLISQCSNACLEYEGREDPDSTWGWDQRYCARLDVLANGALVNILHLGTDCINHQSVCGPECPQGNKRNSCSLWRMKKTVSETTGKLERRWWLYCGSSLILPTMLEKQAWTLLNSAVNWSVNYLIMLSMAVKTQFWHNKEIVQ